MIFYSRTGHWYSGKQISLKSWKCFCKAILLWQHLWKTTVFTKSIRNKGKNDQPKLLKITYSREINQLCAAHRPALDLWIYSFVSNSSKLKACLGRTRVGGAGAGGTTSVTQPVLGAYVHEILQNQAISRNSDELSCAYVHEILQNRAISSISEEISCAYVHEILQNL